MTLTIRRATPDDAEAVAALGRGLNEHEGYPVEHFTAEAMRRDLADPETAITVLLAARGGVAIGYVLFHAAYTAEHAAPGLYLVDLFVLPAERGRGVGRALVAAVAAEAKRRGKTHLWWCAQPGNATALRFYRGIGATAEPVIAHALSGSASARLAAARIEPGLRGRRPSDRGAKSRGRARA